MDFMQIFILHAGIEIGLNRVILYPGSSGGFDCLFIFCFVLLHFVFDDIQVTRFAFPSLAHL